MAHIRIALLLVVLFVPALLMPARPAAAQPAECNFAHSLPEPLRSLFLSTTELRSSERVVFVDGMSLTVRFCVPRSEEAAAHNMLALSAEALPLLAARTDLRLQGALERTMVMVDRHKLGDHVDGYISQRNVIYLHENSLDTTVVHELAHYWAADRHFAEEWMVEAYAEYLAAVVMADLGRYYAGYEPTPICDGLPLIGWRPMQQPTDVCAYSVGSQVFHDLAEVVGAETLQRAIGELSQTPERVTSRALLSRLERLSGANLSPLMRDRVFGPESDPVLWQREAVHGQLAEATRLAGNLGVALPGRFADQLERWELDTAANELYSLTQVLTTAQATRERCAQLQLACNQPWAALNDNPAGWSAVAQTLSTGAQIFTQYEAVQGKSAALGVTIPARLSQVAATLVVEAQAELVAANQALDEAHRIEERCALAGINCKGFWAEAWDRGDLSAVRSTLVEINSMLDLAQTTEQACAASSWPCTLSWRETFQREGPTAAANLLREQAEDLRGLEQLDQPITTLGASIRARMAPATETAQASAPLSLLWSNQINLLITGSLACALLISSLVMAVRHSRRKRPAPINHDLLDSLLASLPNEKRP